MSRVTKAERWLAVSMLMRSESGVRVRFQIPVRIWGGKAFPKVVPKARTTRAMPAAEVWIALKDELNTNDGGDDKCRLASPVCRIKCFFTSSRGLPQPSIKYTFDLA